ncbi:MFS transporter [Actinoplanes sp. NPDC020271]|uniref:MFS transporter n=1 Tax=Actinoplanes sp. NPDC020271 TaxID=3363896 RepID=UPI0037B21E7A
MRAGQGREEDAPPASTYPPLRALIAPCAPRPLVRGFPRKILMTTTQPEAAHTASNDIGLRPNRLAISIMFAIAGLTIGTWTARIPAVQRHLDLSDSQLSIALLALAAGGLIGMRIAGRLCDGHGTRRIMAATAVTVGPMLAVTAYTPGLIALAVALLVLGMLHGTLNVSMNAAAVVCQNAYRRPIMTSFHALFSVGGVTGAAIAGLCAHADLTYRQTFALIGAALTVIGAAAIRYLPLAPSSKPAAQELGPTAGQPPPQHRRKMILLGLLAFCALISEGAAADWSSVYLDRLGASPAYAAAAYAAFAGCMTLGRLAGDRITAAVAPVLLLRCCALVAAAGVTTGILVATPAVAIFGFACLGTGLACVIPLLYSAAGNLDPTRPGAALSRVAALGYLGYVTGPVLVGAAAAPLGLGNALLILPALAALLASAAQVVRPPAPKPSRSRTRDCKKNGSGAERVVDLCEQDPLA